VGESPGVRGKKPPVFGVGLVFLFFLFVWWFGEGVGEVPWFNKKNTRGGGKQKKKNKRKKKKKQKKQNKKMRGGKMGKNTTMGQPHNQNEKHTPTGKKSGSK